MHTSLCRSTADIFSNRLLTRLDMKKGHMILVFEKKMTVFDLVHLLYSEGFIMLGARRC